MLHLGDVVKIALNSTNYFGAELNPSYYELDWKIINIKDNKIALEHDLIHIYVNINNIIESTSMIETNQLEEYPLENKTQTIISDVQVEEQTFDLKHTNINKPNYSEEYSLKTEAVIVAHQVAKKTLNVTSNFAKKFVNKMAIITNDAIDSVTSVANKTVDKTAEMVDRTVIKINGVITKEKTKDELSNMKNILKAEIKSVEHTHISLSALDINNQETLVILEGDDIADDIQVGDVIYV